MLTRLSRFGLLVLVALAIGRPAAHAALKHDYTFAGPAGSTNVTDTVGTATGSLIGNATLSGDGKMILDGSVGYANLPTNVIDGFSAITVETWVSFGTCGAWCRLFDFGATDAGGAGQEYLFFCPHSGAGPVDTRWVVSDADPGYNHEESVIVPGSYDNLGLMHIAAVYDPANNFMAFYTNGVLVATNTATVDIPLSSVTNVFHYIGKSLYAADSALTANIYEFRLYDNPLSASQIKTDFTGGPPAVNLGALQNVRAQLDANLLLGSVQQIKVFGSFANSTNVILTANTNITYQSSSTNVTVSANGIATAKAVGSATVTVSYLGKQTSVQVTVIQVPAVLKHRYSFSGSSTATNAVDSIGTNNAALFPGASLDGNGQMILDGNSGYAQLPAGTISAMTNVTFEAWVTWNGPAGQNWSRIFDFGSNSGGVGAQGTGQTYLFLSPHNGGNGTVRFASTVSSCGGESPVLNGPAPLPVGTESYVAVVYNPSAQIAKLFVGGQLVASGVATIPLKTISDVNNWLGRSQYNDPYFTGSFNEFRLWEGALTDQQIAISMGAGPNNVVTNAGTVKSVAVGFALTNFFVDGMPVALNLAANFQNVSNVNIATFPGVVVTSSNPGVATVAANGSIELVSAGTTTITATYQGIQASQSITVVTAPGDGTPNLIHRYGFSDAVGSTTVKDSVGSADGTVMGAGVFNGTGQLSLPGANAYVALPAGLVSSLTNLTIEAWVTWNGPASQFWSRIFDFGDNSGGPGAQGTGQTYLFLTPHGGNNVVRFAINTGSGESPDLDGAAILPVGVKTHVAVTYNVLAGSTRLFVNGQRVAIGAATLALSGVDDVNVWLGHSQYADPDFNGSYDEFRIFDGALSDSGVAADFAAGPDALPSEVASRRLTATWNAGQVTISWPVSSTTYTLQATSALGAAASWAAVAGTPVVANGQNQVTVAATAAAKFYRLQH